MSRQNIRYKYDQIGESVRCLNHVKTATYVDEKLNLLIDYIVDLEVLVENLEDQVNILKDK